MRPPDAALALLQGPAELLPVSSSAHAALLGADKDLQVALHAGSLLALCRTPVRPWFAALSVAPAAVAGLLLGHRVDELDSPRAIAAGLLVGSGALLAADAARGGERPAAHAGAADALAVGLAQAAALWPGVSRSAATLAAARLRGFAPAESAALSREAGVAVLAAATVRRPPRRHHLAAAALAAASTALAARAIVPPRRLWPFAAYRAALAVGIVWEDRRRCRTPTPTPG